MPPEASSSHAALTLGIAFLFMLLVAALFFGGPDEPPGAPA